MIQKLNTDEEVREIYRLRQQTEFGYISEKNIAVQKAKEEGRCEGEKIGIEKGEKFGIEKGKAEGEKIGEHKKVIETAKKLLNKGLKISDIAECIGLAPEEIKNLR